MNYTTYVLLLIFFVGTSCTSSTKKDEDASEQKHIGEIRVMDDAFNNIISQGTTIDILAEGFEWSEGPLWLPRQQKLIWSDVLVNTVYQWSEKGGVAEYLKPSGYTSDIPRGGEMGSNGLLLNPDGQLVLCQHGDRRLAKMNSDLDHPKSEFTTVTDNYNGKRFNSPNDAVFGPDGNLYFTDPPYGLEGLLDDPSKELDFQGVYKVSTDGTTTLMSDELSRPNGIAFSPDQTKCYIANSDPERAIWMIYDVDQNGDLTNGHVFYDATSMAKEGNGLPDGLKVNKNGILFATGPEGLLVFTPDAKLLGVIHTGFPISNCAFNADESKLFMTSDMYIVKVDLLIN